MQTISSYVNHKIKELGIGILQGNISVNPCEQNGEDACTYCAYRSICGYDAEIAGYETRKLKKLSRDDALMLMEKERGE